MPGYTPGRTRLTEIPNSACEHCGARIVLHREPYTDVWIPYDDSARLHSFPEQYRHNCEDRKLFQKNLEEIKETIIAGAVMRLTIAEENTLDKLAQTAEAMAQYEVAKAVDGATETLHERIDEALAKAVPVEHHIVVHQNGNTPKTITARPHKSLDLLVQVSRLRIHIMLVGPAGSGKSTAASQVANILGVPYYEKSMGPDTRPYELLGFLSPDGNYVPGIARAPFENGGVLMIDEIDNSNASVLTTMNSMLSNHHCQFPDKMVQMHPDFIVIAAGNTYGRGADREYVGRQQLDAATLDRFANLDWDYDEEAEFAWAGVDQYRWVEYVQRVRHYIWDNKLRIIISPRASIKGAEMLRADLDPSIVCQLLMWKGIAQDSKNSILSSVGEYRGNSHDS